VSPGSTNGFGRYSIPSATSSRFYEATAGRGGIGLTFSTPIAAFGFYGIDVGDFNGTNILQLTDTLGKTLDLTVPTPGVVAANGSVLYYGFYDTRSSTRTCLSSPPVARGAPPTSSPSTTSASVDYPR
jgi:hypothetical protein